MKDTYYRVNDNCEQPMIFESLDEALEYLKACLDGINNDSPISIEKTLMSREKFNQLEEL